MSVALPANLVGFAERRADTGRRAWIDSLPEVIAGLADRWSLVLGAPYQPGGQCSWVAPARTRGGEPRVLKVGWRHDEAAHEAEGLRAWAGEGAVRVYDAVEHGDTSALLLERCVPGTSLRSHASGPEQDVVVAGLLRRLWRQPPDGHPFRPLQVMCDAWADEYEAKAFRQGHAADREPWLAADPQALVRRMAELLDLDVERVGLWLFARAVQESFDWPGLPPVARRLAPG